MRNIFINGVPDTEEAVTQLLADAEQSKHCEYPIIVKCTVVGNNWYYTSNN